MPPVSDGMWPRGVTQINPFLHRADLDPSALITATEREVNQEIYKAPSWHSGLFCGYYLNGGKGMISASKVRFVRRKMAGSHLYSQGEMK